MITAAAKKIKLAERAKAGGGVGFLCWKMGWCNFEGDAAFVTAKTKVATANPPPRATTTRSKKPWTFCS